MRTREQRIIDQINAEPLRRRIGRWWRRLMCARAVRRHYRLREVRDAVHTF